MKTNVKTDKQKPGELPGLIAWHVIDRGEKSYWTRVGAAWEHGDHKGFTLDLDLIPVKSGRIVLRDRDHEDEA